MMGEQTSTTCYNFADTTELLYLTSRQLPTDLVARNVGETTQSHGMNMVLSKFIRIRKTMSYWRRKLAV